MGKVCIWFGGTAVALFIGYATVPSTTASWVIAVLWWGFIVVGVLFLLTGLTYLIHMAWRRLNLPSKVTGGNRTDYFSGYVYVAKVCATGGLEVMAKIGDYTSIPVTTNAEGYYYRLEITPPDESYIGRTVRFYVDAQEAFPIRRKTYQYMGGGHGSNFFNLQVEDFARVSNLPEPKPAIGGLIGRLGRGAKVRHSHYKGKITIKGSAGEVDVGSLIGQAEENTEVVDSSADAEIEYKQD